MSVGNPYWYLESARKLCVGCMTDPIKPLINQLNCQTLVRFQPGTFYAALRLAFRVCQSVHATRGPTSHAHLRPARSSWRLWPIRIRRLETLPPNKPSVVPAEPGGSPLSWSSPPLPPKGRGFSSGGGL